MSDPPGLEPVCRPGAAVRCLEFRDAFEIVPSGRADEGERDRTQRHLEQTPAGGRGDVIFALRDRVRDDLDLALVEAEAFIELARSWFARRSVRQADLRRAGFLQHVDNAGT